MVCPACFKNTDKASSFLESAKKAAKGTALFGLALIGPNWIVGALLPSGSNKPKPKQLKRIATTLEAIDIVPTGEDRYIYFSKDGFVPMLLYDFDKNSWIPNIIPYSKYKKFVVLPSESKTVRFGYIEYLTPDDYEPPGRPKPREKRLLGSLVVEEMNRLADEYEKDGPPETVQYDFWFENKDCELKLDLLRQKIKEYFDWLPSEIESETKYCLFCGMNLPANAGFCSKCGKLQDA